jgi:hypothetical protein
MQLFLRSPAQQAVRGNRIWPDTRQLCPSRSAPFNPEPGDRQDPTRAAAINVHPTSLAEGHRQQGQVAQWQPGWRRRRPGQVRPQ